MTPKSHARLLGIFAWIYSGWLGVNLIGAGISLVIFINGLPEEFRLPTLDEFTDGFSGPYAVHSVLLTLVIGAILIGVVLMIAALIANVRMGNRLRGQQPPTKRSILIVLALTLLSALFGGLTTMPFGLALFGYGLWFAVSGSGLANIDDEAHSNPQL